MKHLTLLALTILTYGCGGGGGGGEDINQSYLGLYTGKVFLISNSCSTAPANDLDIVLDVNSDENRSIANETFPSDAATTYTYIGSPINFQTDEVTLTTSKEIPCGSLTITENRKIILTKVDNNTLNITRLRDYAGSNRCENTPCDTRWEGRLTK